MVSLLAAWQWTLALVAAAMLILLAAPAPANADAPNVTGVTVASTSRTAATVTVTVTGSGTFHVRFSPRGQNEWTAVTAKMASAEGDLTFSLTGLQGNAFYDVQVAESSAFTSVDAVTFQNRPANLDFALGSVATGTGNEDVVAFGITGNASTLWVTVFQPPKVGGTANTQYRAYKRTPVAQIGNRDASKDVAGNRFNHTPGGLWTDGTHLHAVDAAQTRTYVYKVSDGARPLHTGALGTRAYLEFMFQRGHRNPTGIWASDDTFWVVSPSDSQLLAYKRSAPADILTALGSSQLPEHGTRDSTRDLSLSPSHRTLRGIWSDGQVMWAVGARDKTAYAYELRRGVRQQKLDIELSPDHTSPGSSQVGVWEGASGIWGDGEHLWVVDSRNNASSVFAYYQPKPAPVVSSLSIASATSTTVTVRAHLIYPDDTKTLYLRHRTPFATSWSSNLSGTVGQNTDIAITGVASNPRLVVQASLDSTFSDGTETTDLLRVRPAQNDVDITGATGEVRGIWTNGAYLWAVHHKLPNEVHAYSLTTRARDDSRSFLLASTSTAVVNPAAIYGSGSTMWVIAETRGRGAGYRVLGRTTSGRPNRTEFNLASHDGQLRGAWSNGTTIWVVDHVSESLLAFNASGSNRGRRDTPKDGALASNYGKPTGIWSNGTTLWVVDATRGRVHAYAIDSNGIGARKPLLEIDLLPENADPWGITGSGTTIWVADVAERRAFAYPLPTAPGGNITNVEFEDVGRTKATVKVTINNLDSSMKTVGLKYMALPGGAEQTTSTTTSGTSVEFNLTGLSVGARYAVQVTLGTDTQLDTPGFKTFTEAEQRGHFLKTSVVSSNETSFPWVRDAYDEMRRQGLEIRKATGNASLVTRDCQVTIYQPPACEIGHMEILDSQAKTQSAYLHEMAHMYSIGAEYMDDDSQARGMGWLYFGNLAKDGTNCPIGELYADAIMKATLSGSSSTYYGPCSNTGAEPSTATLTMTRSVLADEIPAWFNATYEIGEDETLPYDTSSLDGYDKQYDLEEVWTALQALPEARKRSTLYALRDAFGGLCWPQRAGTAIIYNDVPELRNPWRVGGCIPQAPELTLGSTGTVTWNEPPYDGGDAVTRYVVQWKNQDQEYDESRSAEVLASATRTYDTPSTEPGSSVRVSAENPNTAEGVPDNWGMASQPLVAPGKPAAPTVTAGDARLTVEWTPPTRDGGSPITGYDLRYILSSVTNKADSEWTVRDDIWGSGALRYALTPLTNSSMYDVQIRAINGIDDGEWSDTSTGTPRSSDNTLSALSLSPGRLNPAFQAQTTDYTAALGYTVPQITVTATANDAGATLSLVSPPDADAATDGFQIPLAVGSNNKVVLRVTAADGSSRTYNLTVTRTAQDTSLTPPASDPSASFPSQAVYRVTFQGAWTTAVTPDAVPASAHFSPLIGGVHGDGVSFLASGSKASAGVEAMAEEGLTGTLTDEVQAAITAGMALGLLERSGNINPEASATLQATLNTTHPRVTLVTMIAPSPDWFAGVSGRLLLNSGGRWVRSESVNLYPWDAGTEEGAGFSLSNSATEPAENIASIRGTGKFSIERIASLSFELQSLSTTRTVAENAPSGNLGSPITAVATSGSVTYTLGGSDASSFEIVSTTGQLRTRSPLNYESKNSYDVRVTATDADGSAVTSVTIDVTNVDETGSLTLPATQPQEEVAYTATLSDPDILQSTMWTWERSTNRSSWSAVTGAVDSTTTSVYTPAAGDVGYYLRATANYTDGHGAETLVAVSSTTVRATPVANSAPTFTETHPATRRVAEDARARAAVGSPVTATDPDAGDTVGYEFESSEDLFTIDASSGQIRVKSDRSLDHETAPSHTVTVKAEDSSGESATIDVEITVTDVNEPPEALDDDFVTTLEDTPRLIPVLANDSDPDSDDLDVTLVSGPRRGSATVEADGAIRYTPNRDYNGPDRFTYQVGDGGTPPLSSTAIVSITVMSVNDAPTFASARAERLVAEGAAEGDNVGLPVTARDVDTGETLTYDLSGVDALTFDIDPDSGQITVGVGTAFDIATRDTYTVTVIATDSATLPLSASIDVTITVTARPIGPPVTITGGGGGGARGPAPSTLDFEWTVKHDIDELAAGHDRATGMSSDGATLWLAHNGDGADDAIYAYDLKSGERVEDREFELDERNRAPRGVWSDRETMWVSDSGRDTLFAHDLASGDRLQDRDIVLHEDNSDARGIWSGDGIMWVLDSRADALFAYDLASGDLLGEKALDSANGDPHGLWSDGLTIWVSDHGEKDLLAYRLPAIGAEDAPAEADLERVRDEDFTELSKASNNSPRGIWSDGDLMYVADQSDDKVYSYNMPDAIDARLSSLSLEGIDIGEFDSSRTDYEGVIAEGVTETVVTAEAVQRSTAVEIKPDDADGGNANGHQVTLAGVAEITVTVTTADGSRERTYRVALEAAAEEPWAHCLRGDIAVGFSLVVYEGGAVEDLVACAESRDVVALYALHEGVYVSYILGAPDFVNAGFRELYPGGVPALTPLVAGTNGPPGEDPVGDISVPSWSECLRGVIAEGFSLVVYEGGTVEDLNACARGMGVTTLYALEDGEWVSYILRAPEFANHPFRELFAEGLPAITPLVARSNGPPAAGSDRSDEAN